MRMTVEPDQIVAGRGAYLNMMKDPGYGGIGVWTYLHEQPTYLLLKDERFIYFMTFADKACADEWFEENRDRFEVLWSFEPEVDDEQS